MTGWALSPGTPTTVRRALERTVDSYNRFAGSLETRVLVTARQFPGVDAAALASVSGSDGEHRTTASRLPS